MVERFFPLTNKSIKLYNPLKISISVGIAVLKDVLKLI